MNSFFFFLFLALNAFIFFFFHSRCHCNLFIYSGNGVCSRTMRTSTASEGLRDKPGVNSGATKSLLPCEQNRDPRKAKTVPCEQICERRRLHRQTHRERIREYSRRYYFTRRRHELGSCWLKSLVTDAGPSHITDATSGG